MRYTCALTCRGADSNLPEPDRPQQDLHTTCVIAQQYSSTNFVSWRSHSCKEERSTGFEVLLLQNLKFFGVARLWNFVTCNFVSAEKCECDVGSWQLAVSSVCYVCVYVKLCAYLELNNFRCHGSPRSAVWNPHLVLLMHRVLISVIWQVVLDDFHGFIRSF